MQCIARITSITTAPLLRSSRFVAPRAVSFPRSFHSAASLPRQLPHRHAQPITTAATAGQTASCRCCTGTHRPMQRASFGPAFGSSRSFSTIEAVAPPPAETAEPAEAAQAVDPQARFIAVYTCKVCETRSAKSISRQAYTEGVVLVRCDGCQKLHLFADHLGWFDDARLNIEDIMHEKGMTVSRSSLDLTQEQIQSIVQLQQQMAEKAARSAQLKKEEAEQNNATNQTTQAAVTEEKQ